ncbi:hypothetical protein Tco_0349354 [Tanacetum coccineum]
MRGKILSSDRIVVPLRVHDQASAIVSSQVQSQKSTMADRMLECEQMLRKLITYAQDPEIRTPKIMLLR